MLKKILKSYDYSLIVVVAMLAIFGLVMIYSASMVTAIQRYGYESDFFYQKQKLHLILATFVFFIVAMFPYKAMQSNKILVPMVLISLLGLFTLFFFGHVAGNAQSWFKIGARSLQPSEFVKLCVIIYLAAVYAKKQSYINEFNKGVVPPLAYLFLVCLFVAIQPDFGTAAIIFIIAATIIFASGMSYKNIGKLAVIGLMVVLPLVLVMKDEIFSKTRMGRIEAFQDPFAVEQGSGYHLVNSYIAMGAGGIKGLGLGQSIQKLGYLPEPHTDFIMAVIAEELGVLGVAFVLISLGYIVLRGIYIGMRCKDPFGSLLAIGIASLIGIQSFINLAGISGLIPITGVPLPFISYGGSSLLQLSIAMGILVNVSMFVNYEQKYKNKNQTTETKSVTGNAVYFRR
ncbi:FtsW/RodA/SpoVE family cell cycle protein [Cytobacillus spongiae]|jgi:cell division protein FtsW|uniref:FtsW/RodA/SpoVE family cell cycle protein n=1 Tax=Cytobacillus spongiae TaxID=2901381 RepID=UPI001F230001|nr:FtsW/RodA/SpoVE family cell cycle protein [Cytobacillus spongiae]UII57270.1 FtsW/RodA/SpoVE family cell cycle protein [Cytobacillus spongiae]